MITISAFSNDPDFAKGLVRDRPPRRRLAVSGGRAGLCNHGADNGCFWRRPNYPLLGGARFAAAQRCGFKTIEQIVMPHEWDFDAAFNFGFCLILDGVETALGRDLKARLQS